MYYNNNHNSHTSNNNSNGIQSQKNNQITEIFDQWDNEIIHKDFKQKRLHLQSSGLPSNTISQDLYDKIQIYQNNGIDRGTLYQQYTGYYTIYLSEYRSRNHAGAKKLGLNDAADVNVGWKFHLNIRPEDVVAVNNYLKDTGFCYKFLSGGDIEYGKIFTIYVGSYSLMKKLAPILHNDIGKYLCKPQSWCSDIEFAPGIVGRFAYSGGIQEGFNREDKYGFPMIRSLKSLGDGKMELISYRILKEKFGNYFHK